MLLPILALALGCESGVDTAGQHLRTAWEDSRRIAGESLLAAPLRCTVNNTLLGVSLALDLARISRDTLEDVVSINTRGDGDDIGLVDR